MEDVDIILEAKNKLSDPENYLHGDLGNKGGLTHCVVGWINELEPLREGYSYSHPIVARFESWFKEHDWYDQKVLDEDGYNTSVDSIVAVNDLLGREAIVDLCDEYARYLKES